MFFSIGPRFSGKDPKAWISVVESTLFNCQIHPAHQVQFALELLDGEALTWARPRELLFLNRGWDYFVDCLLCEFDKPYREELDEFPCSRERKAYDEYKPVSVVDTSVIRNVEMRQIADEGEIAEFTLHSNGSFPNYQSPIYVASQKTIVEATECSGFVASSDNNVSVFQYMNPDELSNCVLVSPLESHQIGEVVLDCQVPEGVPPDSAMFLSSQPVTGCASFTSEFAGELVGKELVVNEETNVGTDNCSVGVSHKGVATVDTPPAAATFDVRANVQVCDETVIDDIMLMERKTAGDYIGAFLYDNGFVVASCFSEGENKVILAMHILRSFDYNLVSCPPAVSLRSLMCPWCFDPGIIRICSCEELLFNVLGDITEFSKIREAKKYSTKIVSQGEEFAFLMKSFLCPELHAVCDSGLTWKHFGAIYDIQKQMLKRDVGVSASCSLLVQQKFLSFIGHKFGMPAAVGKIEVLIAWGVHPMKGWTEFATWVYNTVKESEYSAWSDDISEKVCIKQPETRVPFDNTAKKMRRYFSSVWVFSSTESHKTELITEVSTTANSKVVIPSGRKELFAAFHKKSMAPLMASLNVLSLFSQGHIQKSLCLDAWRHSILGKQLVLQYLYEHEFWRFQLDDTKIHCLVSTLLTNFICSGDNETRTFEMGTLVGTVQYDSLSIWGYIYEMDISVSSMCLDYGVIFSLCVDPDIILTRWNCGDMCVLESLQKPPAKKILPIVIGNVTLYSGRIPGYVEETYFIAYFGVQRQLGSTREPLQTIGKLNLDGSVSTVAVYLGFLFEKLGLHNSFLWTIISFFETVLTVLHRYSDTQELFHLFNILQKQITNKTLPYCGVLLFWQPVHTRDVENLFSCFKRMGPTYYKDPSSSLDNLCVAFVYLLGSLILFMLQFLSLDWSFSFVQKTSLAGEYQSTDDCRVDSELIKSASKRVRAATYGTINDPQHIQKHDQVKLFTVAFSHSSLLNESLLDFVAAMISPVSFFHSPIYHWLIAWLRGLLFILNWNSDNMLSLWLAAWSVLASSDSGACIWSRQVVVMLHESCPALGSLICSRIALVSHCAVLTDHLAVIPAYPSYYDRMYEFLDISVLGTRKSLGQSSTRNGKIPTPHIVPSICLFTLCKIPTPQAQRMLIVADSLVVVKDVGQSNRSSNKTEELIKIYILAAISFFMWILHTFWRLMVNRKGTSNTIQFHKSFVLQGTDTGMNGLAIAGSCGHMVVVSPHGYIDDHIRQYWFLILYTLAENQDAGITGTVGFLQAITVWFVLGHHRTPFLLVVLCLISKCRTTSGSLIFSRDTSISRVITSLSGPPPVCSFKASGIHVGSELFPQLALLIWGRTMSQLSGLGHLVAGLCLLVIPLAFVVVLWIIAWCHYTPILSITRPKIVVLVMISSFAFRAPGQSDQSQSWTPVQLDKFMLMSYNIAFLWVIAWIGMRGLLFLLSLRTRMLSRPGHCHAPGQQSSLLAMPS